ALKSSPSGCTGIGSQESGSFHWLFARSNAGTFNHACPENPAGCGKANKVGSYNASHALALVPTTLRSGAGAGGGGGGRGRPPNQKMTPSCPPKTAARNNHQRRRGQGAGMDTTAATSVSCPLSRTDCARQCREKRVRNSGLPRDKCQANEHAIR